MTGTLTETPGVRAAASALQAAARTRTPCPPVRETLAGEAGDDPVATGYAVQRLLTAARLEAGRRVVGRKIGLTSPAVQAQLGVDRPDFGVLFDDMACTQDAPIDSTRLLQPRIEAEIAVVLGADLTDDDLDEHAARAAVAEVLPAFEIVDSRITDWNITIVDTVADNASSGLYVLGESVGPLGDRDLRIVEMALTGHDGRVLSSGDGRACLGDPVAALVWLARTSRDLGAPLRAGEVVLTGALGPMVPVVAGATYTATLTGLGAVRAAFTDPSGAMP